MYAFSSLHIIIESRGRDGRVHVPKYDFPTNVPSYIYVHVCTVDIGNQPYVHVHSEIMYVYHSYMYLHYLYTVKIPSERPSCKPPPPPEFYVWTTYHHHMLCGSALPCICPPSLFYLSSTEEGGRSEGILRYMWL